MVIDFHDFVLEAIAKQVFLTYFAIASVFVSKGMIRIADVIVFAIN